MIYWKFPALFLCVYVCVFISREFLDVYQTDQTHLTRTLTHTHTQH